ncbi:hypothetical protein FRX31_012848 [Thalictrum thalictroides]|uniref:Uncharacterized protein n=1 Tax=Thalictrum thalictroides TaxID=46969 RepID=A0A7J6WM99_THATH|nr:hypothetical protein FRX31_012848 [Thalictrum thalictroides]
MDLDAKMCLDLESQNIINCEVQVFYKAGTESDNEDVIQSGSNDEDVIQSESDNEDVASMVVQKCVYSFKSKFNVMR